MFKYLIAVLLVTATVQQTLFLSPPFPPTGFYQQYYEVRFRVRGLNGPTFTFDNLPNFFTGSQDGVVSGTPNITGTFRFTVSYTDGTTSGSDKVVISVTASPNTAASASQSAAVNLLVIQVALDTWIYRSGDAINIQLTSQNGVSPITWNYKNLPAGLSADNNGKISGAISDAGLYSFSASCGDSKGLKAESYYTLNIQPGTIIKSNIFIYSANNVIDVPDRSVPVVYNLSQVAAQQIAADTAVTKALGGVSDAKVVVSAYQANQAKTQLAFNLANSQEQAAEVTAAKAQDIYNDAENSLHRAEAVLNSAKNILAIAETALTNANAVLAVAQANLAKAQTTFDTATSAFNAANAAYTKAINDLTAAQGVYNSAVANVKDAQNAYNIAWTNVQNAKAELDDANNKLQDANAKVTNAKNQVELATQANDDAQTGLNIADAALAAAQHTLEEANHAVGDLRGQFNTAKTALGAAKFNLTQALNNLYVAQAAKEAADKATAIAYAQGASSLDILKDKSTYIFNGCLSQVYPAISGTVSVVNLIQGGAQLSSGHVLTWGDCTTKDNINIGDVIYYEGSIIGNSISAISIVKK